MERQTLAIKCLNFHIVIIFLSQISIFITAIGFVTCCENVLESILKQTEIVLTNVILIEGYKQKKTTTEYEQFSFDCGFLPFYLNNL